MNDMTNRELQTTLDALREAWRNGDGHAFAQWCTGDVDFINLLGMHVKGRPAVAALHDKIFHGPYAGSTVTFEIESIRTIAPNAVLAIVPSRLDIPSGPVQGIVLSVASVLAVRDGGRWKLANFHNTRREATQRDHLSIMQEAIED
ncbi:MAG TPA: SgcJ/EcaC family oxidoreductase [Candidatus Binatia bacterium]|nr:SgcJ/EcaC family oxidoreductase [Candidatus Binatia bacterium]